MPVITSQALQADPEAAKRAALDGPVFIRDGERSSYVLMSVAEYERLIRNGPTIADRLGMVDADLAEFEPDAWDRTPSR